MTKAGPGVSEELPLGYVLSPMGRPAVVSLACLSMPRVPGASAGEGQPAAGPQGGGGGRLRRCPEHRLAVRGQVTKLLPTLMI